MIRKIKILLFFILACLGPASALANGKTALKKVYQYRVYLRDKSGTPFKLSKPEEFLSPRAIARRRRQGISVDSTDLPVSPIYIKHLSGLGLRILGSSRWHNTVTVESATDDVAQRVGQLSEVSGCMRLYASPDSIAIEPRPEVKASLKPDSTAHGYYGAAYDQMKLMNGMALHEAGYKGKGMMIAVMDAGFRNVDSIPAFSNVDIVATKDFAPRRTTDIFAEHYHGTMVLSAMAANHPDTLVGTAPEASYVLIRTEDTPTETPAEEDSWTMGAEYADSIGADLINSSLGYHHWDGDTADVKLRELDGRTWYISQTASMLAQKGIVLCNSAGNDGTTPWHKITVPADAADILTVGALQADSTIASFSSLGPSQDLRVKPDVCVMGYQSAVIDGDGSLTRANGTSFASPTLCGMVACLWQAHPELNAFQVIKLVRSLGDRFRWPDNVYGYGIPDFSKLKQ